MSSFQGKPARRLGDLIAAGIGIEAECQHCGTRRMLDLRALAESFGPVTRLAWLRRRLGCTACTTLPRATEFNPYLTLRGESVQGAFGGAYDHAYETPARKPLTALEGPLRRDPRGRWK